MKLQDIADMKEYLEDRCYCPGEIYDRSGIFYRVYHPNDECEILAEGKAEDLEGSFVRVGDQIIFIMHNGKKVDWCLSIDATENNIREVKDYMAGNVEKMSLNEFTESNVVETVDAVKE